jgi:hypothetical protein
MSTPEAQALPAEVQQELRERWQGLRLAGILAIGLLVGIDLLFAGWGLPTVPGLGKRLATN